MSSICNKCEQHILAKMNYQTFNPSVAQHRAISGEIDASPASPIDDSMNKGNLNVSTGSTDSGLSSDGVRPTDQLTYLAQILGFKEFIPSCEQDLDECATGLRTCNESAVCVNMPGWSYCKCKSGYETHGNECRDINECYYNTHSCHSTAKCVNTEGHFECECSPDDPSCRLSISSS